MTRTTCPKCQHQEVNSNHKCSKCGAKLVLEEGSSTLNIPPVKLNTKAPTYEEPFLPKTIQPTSARISLLILHSGEIIPLVNKNEFVIGRVGGKQTIFPDIDLSPCTAYASGVSRLHATIKEKDGKFYIVDLDSTNGTWLNKKKLSARKETPLHNGDRVILGHLEIMVIAEEDSF